MNYITTNIRLSEEDYFRLKGEAAKQRKSLSALIREKVSTSSVRSNKDIKKILSDLDIIAARNAKKLQDTNGTSLVRKMRSNAKW